MKGTKPIQINSIIYEFGGLSNEIIDSNSNEFITTQSMIISDLSQMKRYIYTDFDKYSTPSPRFDYSICSCQNQIYLFGGRNEKNEIFNDLFIFLPLNFKWISIEIEGLLPPPLFSSILFSDQNDTLYLFGGESNIKDNHHHHGKIKHDGTCIGIGDIDLQQQQQQQFDISTSIGNTEVRDSIFCLNNFKKWECLIITGPSLPTNIQSDQFQIPRKNHQYCFLNENLFISDGFIDSKKKESSTHSILINGILDFNQIIYENQNIISYLKKLRKQCYENIDINDSDNDSSSNDGNNDLITFFTIDENEKNSYIKTYGHKSILSIRCKYFKSLIQNNNDKIYLNDVKKSILESYFNFLYFGEINLKSDIEIFEFLNFSKKCKTHYQIINKIINSIEIYIDLNKIIIENIKNDLYSLINEKLNSDIKFEIFEPEFDIFENENEIKENENNIFLKKEKKEIFVHKIFLEQSNYFKSILDSGMKESIENLISFSDIKYDTMIHILNFLYTSK